MPWMTIDGKRKWISSKKARRHKNKGDNTEAYKDWKLEEYRQNLELRGIRSRLDKNYDKYLKQEEKYGN